MDEKKVFQKKILNKEDYEKDVKVVKRIKNVSATIGIGALCTIAGLGSLIMQNSKTDKDIQSDDENDDIDDYFNDDIEYSN